MKATYTHLADGSKYKTINASGGGFDYVGSFRYNRNGSNITLESVIGAGGRIYKTSSGYETRYFVSDHLGSTRIVAYANGTVIEQNDYMPYGERHSNSTLATSGNPYLYNGKESQKDFGINYIDSEARFQRLDGAFNSIDPLCEEYYHISPYAYCGANPIAQIDPNGLDWYSYVVNDYDLEGNIVGTHTEYAYTKYKSQKELDEAGIIGTYQGEIVVVFDGAYSEKLGAGDNLHGEGAILADVIVYGANGMDDIAYYSGFTMSSNFDKFGAIADGEYYVSHIDASRSSGRIPKTHIINNGNPINCINDINPSPAEYKPYSKTQKNGIFVHRSNYNGWAGDNATKFSAVSTGCLLIPGKQWDTYDKQIGGRNYKLILKRSK